MWRIRYAGVRAITGIVGDERIGDTTPAHVTSVGRKPEKRLDNFLKKQASTTKIQLSFKIARDVRVNVFVKTPVDTWRIGHDYITK